MAEERRNKFCLCPCKRPLKKGQTKWANGSQCRYIYHMLALRSGCLPISQVEFKICPICKEDFLAWKQREGSFRTCSSFSGKECSSEVFKDNEFASNRTAYSIDDLENFKETDDRPREIVSRIQTYCIQKEVQCSLYFDLKDHRESCMGRHKFTGNCYKESL